MIKAVIFDLDGVLVSTDVLHFKAWKALAGKMAIVDTQTDSFPLLSAEALASVIRSGLIMLGR